MSNRTTALNGTPLPAPSVAKPAGRIWPAIIVSLLSMNACIVAITVYFATSDKSVATEPDYYAKAVDFGNAIEQRTANARLGWSAHPTLRASHDGRTMELAIALADREGSPIADAAVSAVVFASARAGQRQSLALSATDPASGVYLAPLSIDRSGVWNIRINAARGRETFTRETDLLVPELPR